MKFRKKPVVIEAWRVRRILTYAESNWKEMPKEIEAEYEKGNIIFGDGRIFILTLEGKMTADYDDWLIKGVKGEFYPCKPDIFEATYEEVSESESSRKEAV